MGERTEEALHRLGLRTVGDLARTPASTLCAARSAPRAGAHLHALAWGRDERARRRPTSRSKSIGAEETFATDVDDPARDPARAAAAVASGSAARLRQAG